MARGKTETRAVRGMFTCVDCNVVFRKRLPQVGSRHWPQCVCGKLAWLLELL